MAEFALLLEFEDNKKNSKLIEALNSKVGKKFTIRRSDSKALIKESLFDALQMTIESSDVDSISLMQISGSKIERIISDAEVWSSDYDVILRKLRYDRKLS